jgi:hypothetical protein
METDGLVGKDELITLTPQDFLSSRVFIDGDGDDKS